MWNISINRSRGFDGNSPISSFVAQLYTNNENNILSKINPVKIRENLVISMIALEIIHRLSCLKSVLTHFPGSHAYAYLSLKCRH